MGELVIQMQLSIDGYVARSRDEDFSWILPTLDSDYEKWGVPALWAAGFHVMGAETGKGLAEYWPTSTDSYAPAMNEIPKVVFSKQRGPHRLAEHNDHRGDIDRRNRQA